MLMNTTSDLTKGIKKSHRP